MCLYKILNWNKNVTLSYFIEVNSVSVEVFVGFEVNFVGPGTRERPNLIPSSNDKRLVACSCSPCDNHLEFMWLHLGCPKRCGCGYWFELCPVAPL
ncbi:hypothetical protein HF086_016576 [Spodoptera exigua]|uniref:Uncharacterized protein n=1 Tax=Spodoptera exigua TaxID=7107 RepID=A0A922M8M8_SPOEX|nr:hypothetical protein HF086_016576 [Spodoptera exigua]